MLNVELKQIATQSINFRVNTVGKQIQSYLFTCCKFNIGRGSHKCVDDMKERKDI